MRRVLVATATLVALWAPASMASAGVYTDELSKCLVKASTPADQTAFMVWLFSAMSAHPAVRALSNVTPAQRDAASKTAAGLVERFITVDCRAESVAAVKYEGPSTFEAAFGVFGQVAMRGLMADADVNAALNQLAKYMDNAKFEAIGKEAGLQVKSAADPAAKPK